jgi:hypothetical protein
LYIVQTAASRSKEVQAAKRKEETKYEEEGSEGSESPAESDSDPEVDLFIGSRSSDSSGSEDEKAGEDKRAAKAASDDSDEERAANKKAARKAAKKKARKRRTTTVTSKLTSDLAQMRRAAEKEKEEAAKIYSKTVKDGQTKLPELDGDMSKGYESGVKFKARAKGSLYNELQQIQALETQTVVVKDGKSSPREPKCFRIPNELLDVVKLSVVKGIRDETKKFEKKQVPMNDYDFEESGEEWLVEEGYGVVLGEMGGGVCEARGAR